MSKELRRVSLCSSSSFRHVKMSDKNGCKPNIAVLKTCAISYMYQCTIYTICRSDIRIKLMSLNCLSHNDMKPILYKQEKDDPKQNNEIFVFLILLSKCV